MDVVPDEIIAQILSYFHPIYEDLAGYSIICRRWERIIQNTGLLWRHIHLHDDRGARETLEDEYARVLQDCLKRFGQFIQCVRAEDQSLFIRPELRRLLLTLPNLTRLDVLVLSWSRVFAQSLKSASVLKFLTIDDYRAVVKRRASHGNGYLRIHRRGIRVWDLRVLARQFTSLESLTLNINIFKLYRYGIIPVLDQLHLRELHLECAPYGMDEISSDALESFSPISALMNSRHASILVSLDLHYLPLSTEDLVSYVENFKCLQQLFVAVSEERNIRSSSSLVLKSESITTLFLTGLPSTNVKCIKCVLPKLEVILISECHHILSFEVLATNILSFILQGNCQLSKIKVHCKSIRDLLMYDCPAIEPEMFHDFLSECPNVRQMELSVDWAVIELGSNHCRNLKQLTLRDVSMSLSKLIVDCPTLEYFKCSGEVFPAKHKSNKNMAGCDIEMHADHLRKFQMCDVGCANRVTVHCIEANIIQITGIQPWRRPLIADLNAVRRIDTVFFTGLTIGAITLNSSYVEHVIIDRCSLANRKKGRTMRFKCEEIRALRLLDCHRMKKFSLHVKSVQNLSIESCSNLRDLDVSASKLSCVRIYNCPYLEQVNQTIAHNT